MENPTTPNKPSAQNRLSIIGLITFFLPVAIWIRWIYIFQSNDTLAQEEKVEMFLSFFPSFMRTTGSISMFVLITAAAAIVCSAIGRKKADETFKVLNVFVIVLSSIIVLLQLFSMM